jgi:hypothetical protein
MPIVREGFISSPAKNTARSHWRDFAIAASDMTCNFFEVGAAIDFAVPRLE